MAKEKKLTELSDEELKQVNGGYLSPMHIGVCNFKKCPELGKKTDLLTCECI